MDLSLLISNPGLAKDITLHLNGDDLLTFANKLVSDTAKETSRLIEEASKPDELLTRAQVSDLLGVSLTTLFHWNNKKILTTLRIGNKVRYTRSSIDLALSRNNNDTSEKGLNNE